MNIPQKAQYLKEAVDRQLQNYGFTATPDIKRNVTFFLTNDNEENAFNTLEVSSLEEAKEIVLILSESDSVVKEGVNFTKPLYLSVVANLPK